MLDSEHSEMELEPESEHKRSQDFVCKGGARFFR